MLKIFISYRRDDNPYVVHTIHDKLGERFGRDNIVYDVDSVPPGLDFRRYLDEQVRQCDVLLAVIGDKWLSLLEHKTRNPPDYVRTEIQAALKRDIPVIPVLVDKAAIPKEKNLPTDIAGLAYRSGLEIRGGRDLAAHLNNLCKALDYYIAPDKRPGLEPRIKPDNRKRQSKKISPEAKNLLDNLASLQTEPPRRLEIGDRLDALGDPRPGVGLDTNGLPDIDWVEIPAGEFIYGEDEEQQTLHLDTFYMARYPVTNAQYQAFIANGGYDDERWWQGIEKPEQQEPQWNQSNRPRTDVNWYEAIAFCRWLSSQRGYEISLPTEQQWEKAARGPEGLEYPWGNGFQSGFANVDETLITKQSPWNLEQTSAVGVYPQGCSPYGLQDMAGNVWDWCLNEYYNKDQTAINNNSKDRVLRGGSWGIRPEDARSSQRRWNGTEGRDGSVGFRLWSSLPYTEH